MADRLHIVAVDWKTVRNFVNDFHRHLRAPKGHKFSVGVATPDRVLVGVAVVGRPNSRHQQDGQTLQVTRVATDGTPNACSALYGACWRVTRALGYSRLITHTSAEEPGTSLVAAGWRLVDSAKPNPGWDRPSRPREPRGFEDTERLLWEVPV